jgi:hypothetical protein
MCWAGAGNCPPALLTSTSIAPNRSTTPPTKRSTSAASRMSHTATWTPSAPPGATAASSARAASSLSAVRPQIAIRAPRRASSAAVARPMPDPPPVTSAT